MDAQAPIPLTVLAAATMHIRITDIVGALMATMAMIALYHMQSALHITTVNAIILVVATATDQTHVTVMHVDSIPTSITGDTVYVMMDMQVTTVQRVILTQILAQIATIHVQEAVMDLKCTTVSTVVIMRIWMPMDTVPASMGTMEITVIRLMTQVITTITSTTDIQHLTLTTTMDTLETITTMEAM